MVAIERRLSKVETDLAEQRDRLHTLTLQRAHLARLAVERGLSHRAIAELLDVSHTAVQKMLREHPAWCACGGAGFVRRIRADDERAELRKANRVEQGR